MPRGTKKPQRSVTKAEWEDQGTALFGANKNDWRFVCPACGYVQTPTDYRKSHAPRDAIAFSCVGRWRNKARKAFGETGPGPCDYAGGGLFSLNPVCITDHGDGIRIFEFAPQEGQCTPTTKP